MGKTVNVINKRDRIFNGIRYNQITSIPEQELDAYERMWFQKFVSKPKKGEKNEQRWNSNVESAIQFLKEQGVNVGSSWKTNTILKKAKEKWRNKDEEGDDTGAGDEQPDENAEDDLDELEDELKD